MSQGFDNYISIPECIIVSQGQHINEIQHNVLNIPTQDNDNDAVREESDEDKDWHEVAVDNLNNIKRTQPSSGIDKVATSSFLAPDEDNTILNSIYEV